MTLYHNIVTFRSMTLKVTIKEAGSAGSGSDDNAAELSLSEELLLLFIRFNSSHITIHVFLNCSTSIRYRTFHVIFIC